MNIETSETETGCLKESQETMASGETKEVRFFTRNY